MLCCARSLQSCLTLQPMDCSPLGCSVHRILQARILEWVAVPSSTGSSWPRDQTHISAIFCIAGRFFTHWAPWEAQTHSRGLKLSNEWVKEYVSFRQGQLSSAQLGVCVNSLSGFGSLPLSRASTVGNSLICHLWRWSCSQMWCIHLKERGISVLKH